MIVKKESKMTEQNYEVMQDGGVPVKSWTKGVPFEAKARAQLKNISRTTENLKGNFLK